MQSKIAASEKHVVTDAIVTGMRHVISDKFADELLKVELDRRIYVSVDEPPLIGSDNDLKL